MPGRVDGAPAPECTAEPASAHTPCPSDFSHSDSLACALGALCVVLART